MRKVLQIALNEYKRRVARKSFILVLLMPLIILVVAVVVGFLSASAAINSDKGVIGYIDPSNALVQAVPPPAGSDNTFERFPDRAAADAALREQKIIAYYALAPDFASSGKSDFVYWQNQPDRTVKRAFERFARTALLDGSNAQVMQRLLDGSNFTLRTPDGSRTFSDNDIFSIMLPLGVAILFIIALFSGASYLMQAVVDEKENRTIEIMITSVTPMQLMSGKILGLAAVGLTQVGVWVLAGAAAFGIARERVEFLQAATIDPGFLILALVLSVLQYLLLGSFMAAIGSVVLDVKQGQSWSSPVTLISMTPMFFFALIVFDPNSIIAVILSLFPLTAPLTLLLRYNMTSVPAWQIIAAIALLALSVVGAMWLAARIFRIGMLRFGQAVKISEIAASIRF
ncbi:MAG: ABC transporter permease [Chloroflexi bacterium]|nr:ABC transporter permease [Chloroflexota bacterium]MCL5274442.1 ABC transporter permease [Chloroflexota bacterium]